MAGVNSQGSRPVAPRQVNAKMGGSEQTMGARKRARTLYSLDRTLPSVMLNVQLALKPSIIAARTRRTSTSLSQLAESSLHTPSCSVHLAHSE